MVKTSSGVHFVKCPKCHEVLHEPNAPVYRCGGCGAILRAKLGTTSGETTTTNSNLNISMDLTENDSFGEVLTVLTSKSSILDDNSEETVEQKILTTEMLTRNTEKLDANRSVKEFLSLVKCPKCHELLHEPNAPVYRCGGCGTILQAKLGTTSGGTTTTDSNSNISMDLSESDSFSEPLTVSASTSDTEPFGASSHEIPLIGRQSISPLKRLQIENWDMLHVLPGGLIPCGPRYRRVRGYSAHDLSILPYSTGHTMDEARTFGRDADKIEVMDFLPSEKEKSISVISINDKGGLKGHMMDKATMVKTSSGVRFVICPCCYKLLHEPNAPVYRCGGCGAILRAKLGTTSRETTTTESNPNISMDLSENDSFSEPLTISTSTPDTEPSGASSHEIPLTGRQIISSLKRLQIENWDTLHVLLGGLIPCGPRYRRVRGYSAHDLSILPYSTGHTMDEARTFGRDADKMEVMDILPSEKEKSISVISINDKGVLTDHMVDKATIFGRSAETKEVSNILLSERGKSFSVISIVGKGGLGKTTIAQLVYKDLRASRCFDLFGWVCISEGFDVRRLIKATVESISKINYGVSDLSPLQVELAEIVKGKTILLVLDDVCNDNQSLWELFQDSFIEAKMVRILVTTRNEKVGEVMKTTTCYRPSNLSEYSCWQLFQRHALGSTNVTLPMHLVDMGREIMRKCDGLPLAVKIIASLLRHETNEEVWREILESDLWESNPTNNIFPALQISYEHLPAHLKLCFLVSSMYPKDYLLEKINLIDLWISHGYIESRGKRRITEIGVEYYEELKERSFLDSFSNCIPECWHMQPMYILDDFSGQFIEFCKLHDIIHDLARYNSKKEHYSMVINQPLDIQKENFPPEVHHLYAGGYVGYVKQILQRNDQNLKDLRTLSVDVRGCSGDLEHQYCINNTEAVDLNSKISIDYEECFGEAAISNLIKFEGLVVLELKGYNLRNIPDSISKLKHLAYLGITSSCLKMLPISIGLLYNLQTLFLDCFLLEYLPESIGNLANLQFLHIQSGRIKKLPKSLCSLNNLLRLVIRSDDLEEVPLDIKNLCNLHTLTIRSNQIQALPNTIGCLSSLEELNLLSLGGSYDDLPVGKLDYVPHGFVNFPAIKTMAAWMGVRTINWLKDMMDLEGKLSIGGLINMSNLEDAQHANLRNKCKLETLDLCWDPGYYISPYDTKSELRLSLIPEACTGELVCADDVVSFSLLEFLQPHPNLKKLLIRWYPSATVPNWMRDPSSFWSIQEVLLECCVNIQSLPFENFQTLKHLTIVACSSIRVLQLELVSCQLEKLQIVSCDNLELITGLGDLDMLAALEIYSCQALKSLTMGGKQLVLPTETFRDSSHEKPRTSQHSITSLGRLEIENCYLLHFLPDGLIPPGPCYVCVRGCGCPDMERNLTSAINEISCTSNLWRWR